MALTPFLGDREYPIRLCEMFFGKHATRRDVEEFLNMKYSYSSMTKIFGDIEGAIFRSKVRSLLESHFGLEITPIPDFYEIQAKKDYWNRRLGASYLPDNIGLYEAYSYYRREKY